MEYHRWDRVKSHVFKCRYCDVIKLKEYGGTMYKNIDGTQSIHSRGCERIHEYEVKEKRMKLLDIIDEAKRKGIMPDLKDGVFLKIDNFGDVKMINKSDRYRTLFNVNDDMEVNLAHSLDAFHSKGYAVGKNNSYRDFIESHDTTRDKIVRVKIGEKIEERPHEVSYIDTDSKEITIKEKISVVVPVYEETIEQEQVKLLTFLKSLTIKEKK